MLNLPLPPKVQQFREHRQKAKPLVLKSNKLLESKMFNPEVGIKEQYTRKCKHNHTPMHQKVTLLALHFCLYNLLGLHLRYPYHTWSLLHMITLESQSLQRKKRCFNNTNEKSQIHHVQDASHCADSLAEVQLWISWNDTSVKEWGHILSCGKSQSAMTVAAVGPLKTAEQHWLSPAAVLGQLVQFSGQV